MATSLGFNKPKIDFIKVNRKKRQEKRKQKGTAEAGQRGKLAVSGVRTKKHAKKMAHREKMLVKHAEEQVAQAAAEAEASAAAAPEVKMGKASRVKKPKAQKSKAMQE